MIMKNIHILPTDKPSKLWFNLKGKLVVDTVNCLYEDIQCQNIYITNDEEIKEGDWCIDDISDVFKIEGLEYFKKFCKKIILTTDTDLIKDGVQVIDDEFLEWFVKNPSCEEVEVEKDYSYGNLEHFDYKIIIPKDYSKIKEGLEKSIKGKEHFVQHFKNGGTVEDFKPTEETCTCIDECLGYLTKTCKGIETLEEFIKEVLEDEFFTNISEYKKAERLIDIGAKWQQDQNKKLYSEEEVLTMLSEVRKGSTVTSSINNRTYWEFDIKSEKKWFEQFKKK